MQAIKFTLYFALVIAVAVWQAFVTSLLWGWFVVVPFGLPALGTAQAFGLGLVVSSFTYTSSKHDGTLSERATHMVLAPTIFLAIGWIARGFL